MSRASRRLQVYSCGTGNDKRYDLIEADPAVGRLRQEYGTIDQVFKALPAAKWTREECGSKRNIEGKASMNAIAKETQTGRDFD